MAITVAAVSAVAGCALTTSFDGLAGGGEGASTSPLTDAGDASRTEDSAAPSLTCDLGAVTQGLILYYPFEETSGVAVTDCSPTKATGTVIGAGDVASLTVNGKRGRALGFDGVRSCVRVDSPVLATNGAFTVAAWVSVRAYPSDGSSRVVAGRTTSSSNNGWRFGADVGSVYTLKLGAMSGAAFVVEGSAQPTAQWKHVAALYAPSKRGEIYVDGVLDAADTSAPARVVDSASAFYVGCLSGSNYFDGLIDELKVYDRALDAAEISALATDAR